MKLSMGLLLLGVVFVVVGVSVIYAPLGLIVSGCAISWYALTREDGS